MSVAITIVGICEQDMDLFFLEEVVSNTPFRGWLLSNIPDWPEAFDSLKSAGRSIAHLDGETDLEFTFQDASGRLAGLLIENKIGAGFQPDQLLRYRARASGLLSQPDFQHVACALLAPKAYASGVAGKIDAMISYEEVAEWLSAQEPTERTHYKLHLVRRAIEKQGSGYNPDSDQPATDFWQSYWREAAVRAPELAMKQPGGKTSASGFVWFSRSGLPADLSICHKLWHGFVDLQFAAMGKQISQLAVEIAPLLEPHMRTANASGSAAIRIAVPSLRTGMPFDEQIANARVGIDAAKELRVWARLHSAKLSEIGASLRA